MVGSVSYKATVWYENLRKTLLVSYATQAYISLIGIFLMPLYLRYLGAEAFGLVGLYVMLQAWILVLDMGLTSALTREMSRFRAGTLIAEDAAVRLFSLEFVQGVVAVTIVGVLWVASGWVGGIWLSAVHLSENTLAHCITLIGFAVALRWLAGLHRAALMGLERHDWVNGLSVGFATLRFVGVVPLLMYISGSPVHFFAFQAGASLLELFVFATVVHRLVPGRVGSLTNWRALAAILPMVGSMSFLVVIWVVVTQVDKLILSGLLPLKEYGYFTLAVTAAGGVLVLMPPLNQVIQPRLIILAERGDETNLVELYRLSSQLSVIAFVGLGGGLAFFAEPVLRVWSGSNEAAQAAAPVLFWYGLANAVVGILALPFMLQFAKGALRLHVLGNLILLVTLVPALVFAALHWGARGAGQVYFIANLLFLLFWVPLVHRYFLPILAWRWLLRDTLPIALVMLGSLAIAAQLLPASLATLETLLWVSMATILSITLGIVLGDHSRCLVLRAYSGKRK
jgi:O-antigen/teichoic acid export membrane protein